MNSKRIQAQHLEEQVWRHLRDYREDIERVVNDGLEPDDEHLVKTVFSYTLSRMKLADYDLEEA